MNEFSLINQFFKSRALQRDDVIFGIGDDAACVHVPNGTHLLVSTDTLVAGVHFLAEWSAYDIACKSVMVNISDLAAMAATPCWVTLALTLPDFNEQWLDAFSQGLSDSLKQFNVALIGGDITKGPLSITLTIMGLAPYEQSIRRSGAQSGDVILVSGPLGAAALAVQCLNNHEISPEDNIQLMDKLVHPKPRIDLLHVLRNYASSAIDISDGLSADLNHICVASGVGACVTQNRIPLHPLLNKYLGEKESFELALEGGDDYELCFTVPAQHLDSLLLELKKIKCICYPVGVIEKDPGLRIKTMDNECEELTPKGYSHF